MNTRENMFHGLEELENRTFLSATSFAEFDTPGIDIGSTETISISASIDSISDLGNYSSDICQSAVSKVSDPVLSEDEGLAAGEAEIKFEVTTGEVYYAYTSGEGVGNYRLYLTTSDEVIEPVPDTTVEPQEETEVQTEEDTGSNNDDQTNQDDSSSLVGVETLEAGAEITSGYYTINSENWFVVLGTDQSDHIELGYSAGSINVFDGTTVSAYDGDVQGVLVLGFVGDDYIRSDASLNVYTVLDGGTGNDNIYKASMAAGELIGGAGNDLMVSIGGGADRLTGLAGEDSFWADSADTIVDASADETNAQAVHIVTEFYQPYTSNTSSDYYVSLNIEGQDLADPVASSYSTGWSNFAASPLFVGDPHYSDIDQGSIGDCYFLAVLAGYAHDDPNIIRQMVTDLGDGTYAVRFFRDGQENYLRVDADLAVNGSTPTYAGLGDEGELWVAIAEKAYAYFRYGDNSYSSLNSGWMHTVYSEVSGSDSKLKWTSGMSTASMLAYVEACMADGDTVSVGSVTGGSGPIAGGHAYAVLSIDYEGTQAYVTVYNPWGIDGRSYDSDYYDGELRITAEQFKSAFTAIAVSYA